jgi:general secretion pathway protein M
MKEWLANLQPRERLIVVGGGIAAAIIALWLLVLSPLQSDAANLRGVVASKQRLLVDLGRVEGLQAAGSSSDGAPQQTLVVLISNTAKEHGLALPRQRADGPDGINVTLQSVSFDALVDWLVALETTHSVHVESANISSAREQGLVNGQVFLRR